MQANTPSSKAASCLLLCAALTASAQNQPDYTEFSPPAGSTGFASDFGGLPDLTQDGVGEFYVFSSERADVYDGESLKLLYSMQSPCKGGVSGIQAAGDLTGDGIQDLMGGHACLLGGQVSFFNGANGELLFTISSPSPVRLGLFGGAAMRLLPDMTGDGKEDWLIHQPEFESQVGRVYIFDSQTRRPVRTIRNTGTGFTFHMANVEVIPDVDRDGKPELLVGAHGTSVRQDGQTLSNAGRVIVRSLETGAVLYELHDPEPQKDGGFGLVLRGIGDITGDGIGDIAVGTHFKDVNTDAIYLFSGADGRWVRTLRSPDPQPGGLFGRKIEVLPDLNDDGVPELFMQEDEFNLTYVYDGATSALLKTIEYPGPWGPFFLIGTVLQQAPPGIRAYLFNSPYADGNSGRLYYMPFTPIAKPARLKPAARTSNGFRLQITGEPGHKLEIQGTGDFKTWEPISVVTMGNQPMAVEDSAADSQPQRFYRTVQRE